MAEVDEMASDVTNNPPAAQAEVCWALGSWMFACSMGGDEDADWDVGNLGGIALHLLAVARRHPDWVDDLLARTGWDASDAERTPAELAEVDEIIMHDAVALR